MGQFFTILPFFFPYLLFYLGVTSFLNVLFILIVYLFSFFKRGRGQKFEPGVSIVIPTFNEEKVIASCLDSLLISDYSKSKTEVICVNDGSTDNTPDILKKYHGRLPNFRILNVKHGGKANSLNIALKKASNEFVIVIDSDMILEKESIRKIVAPLKDKRIGYSFGIVRILHKKSDSLLEYYQALEFNYMNLVRIATSSVLGYPLWFSGQFVCYRKSALNEVQQFDPKLLIEDFDISLRLYKSKYKSAFVNDANSYTHPMNGVWALVKQRMRWSYGAIQTLLNQRTQSSGGSLVQGYIILSYTLWFLNSVFFFPLLIYTFFIFLVSGSLGTLGLILNSLTFNGTILFLHAWVSKGIYNINMYVYGLIGLLLLILYVLGIVFIGRKFNFKIFFSLYTYFFYMAFMQGCYILSFIYYPLNQIKSFERK